MMRRLVIWMVLLLALCGVGLAYFALRPMSLPHTPLEFSLRQGSSLKVMAREMAQTGVLSQDWAFVWLVRLLGKDQQIKAGSYVLEHAVTPLELLQIISEGQVNERRLSVIEGWTFRQFRRALDAAPELSHDTQALSDSEILRRIGAQETHPEGLFFPDTYHFAAGSSDLAILQRAYQTMQQRLQHVWQQRASGLPLQTPYQALILASIVEKETGVSSDRAMIAGVFVNRLHQGMLLQTDPTVIYGLGEHFEGNLHKRDLLADTPYNTYTRAGLPPTPIALPGAAALQAALHPAQTDALYFVAKGDGSSYFSSSLSEHNHAVNKYQK